MPRGRRATASQVRQAPLGGQQFGRAAFCWAIVWLNIRTLLLGLGAVSPAPAPTTAAMSGFTIAAKRKQKVAVNINDEQERRQLITGLEGQEIQAAEGQEAGTSGRKVVPRQENTYRAGNKKFAPTFKPPSNDIKTIGSTEDKFELAPDAGKANALTSFGLEVRSRKREGDGAGEPANGAAPPINIAASLADRDKQQLNEDLEALPDEATVDVSSRLSCDMQLLLCLGLAGARRQARCEFAWSSMQVPGYGHVPPHAGRAPC